jgi:hypothetical protein
VSAPVDCVPLVALAPDQAPEAVQAVALVEDQVSEALPPWATELGPTLNSTVGSGDLTETVTAWLAVPPAPWQVSTYVEDASTMPVDCEPLVALAPAQAPAALHAVAFTDFHDRVALAPLAMVLGAALSSTLGAGAETLTVAVCEALPPKPEQVNV